MIINCYFSFPPFEVIIYLLSGFFNPILSVKLFWLALFLKVFCEIRSTESMLVIVEALIDYGNIVEDEEELTLLVELLLHQFARVDENSETFSIRSEVLVDRTQILQVPVVFGVALPQSKQSILATVSLHLFAFLVLPDTQKCHGQVAKIL